MVMTTMLGIRLSKATASAVTKMPLNKEASDE